MGILDFLILLLLFVLLGLGAYILWLNYPTEKVRYEEYYLNISEGVYSSEVQFYPNMRYRDRVISYSISNSCNLNQGLDAERAFSIISEKTILRFNRLEDRNAEIKIFCSDLAPEPEEEGHFVAGEGGPSEIINTSNYAVIFSGKVSLYRENECKNPNIALHEIIHALGFDHNDNEKSIMYPLTKCDQEVDPLIIEEINRIYKADSKPDLVIERVIANKSGRYLNFEIGVGNFGLKDSKNARLVIYVGGEFINDFNLEEIEIGSRKILTVENLKVPRNAEIINFVVENFEPELDSENNRVDIRLVREQ